LRGALGDLYLVYIIISVIKKKKILQIFNKYLEYGGEEGCVIRVAEAMSSTFEVSVYYGSTHDQLDQPFGRLKVPFYMLKNNRILNELRDLQEQNDFDAWQVDNVFPTLSVAVYELAHELRIPIIQYLHNYRFGCPKATYFRDGTLCRLCKPTNMLPGIIHSCWRSSAISTAAMAFSLKRFWKHGAASIRGYISPSERQKQLHVSMGIPADKIHVIPHFYDPKDSDLTEYSKGGREVLYIGRITEEKGVGLLLKAWSSIDTQGRILRIIGAGADLVKMQQFVQDCGMDNVIFEGFVEQSKHSYFWENAAFSVAPSIWEEPFGMVVLEAWSQKRPILTTNLGSFPDLIDDGVNGWLSEPTVESLAKCLDAAFLADCESIGKNGYADLKNKYSKSIWTEKMVDVYSRIID
jgi:glycosyltransferase involved in cell wall biosynthesis